MINFDDLPVVPAFVGERVAAYQSVRRRTQPSSEGVTHTSSLFGTPDYGPDGGYKTVADATALLDRELKEFVALRTPGNARSHILSQRLGVLAGHGVPHMWSEEVALKILLDACEENGFSAVNGYDYAEQQARRGIEFGMREPWHLKPEPAPAAAEVQVTGDAVDALLAEMLTPSQIKQRPRPRYLIKGYLSLDSESWLIGEPGSKKSFVALDIAGHVAAGQEWQGRKVSPATVVYIVAEGAGGIGDRIKAYEALHGPMSEHVHFLPRPVQAKNMQAWAVLVEACRRLEPGLVVIDTQARVTVGLEENSATELGIYIEAVRATREATGACVLTVHHTGRKGGDARGSSAIDGAQTTELKVESTGLDGRLLTEKQKDLALAEPLPLKFSVQVVGMDEDGEDVTSLALVADGFRAAVGEERPEEQEPWEIGHGEAQVRLLKVLRDQGGSVGLTKAEARAAMIERFYGKDALRLPRSTWQTAWTKVLEKVSSEGDQVVTGVGGARFAVDLIALEALVSGQ